jgi:L-rhamnonate dehydratase
VAVAAPIESVEAIVLRLPTVDAVDLDGSCETVVALLTDAEGRVGIGEADAPADAVRTLLLMDDVHARSRGVRSVLLGRDPFEIAALWNDLYHYTSYHGRRGLGIHALSAIDIALHDLVGKQLGRPAYQLLGGARRTELTPYATVYGGPVEGRTIGDVMDVTLAGLQRAVDLGFRAAKMEVIFEDLVSDRQLVACIEEGRRVLGDDVAMMLSFGFRWTDWRDALWVLRRIEDCNVYFAQATLPLDDLAGHVELARRVDTRIAGAEGVTTVHEARDWIERHAADVLQPDPNRCGGLSEIRRIAELAALEGIQVVPHAWKTGITLAAAAHFQAATANAPYIEAFVPELFPSPLRSRLVTPEPLAAFRDGVLPLPTAPGLGVELVADTVAEFRV